MAAILAQGWLMQRGGACIIPLRILCECLFRVAENSVICRNTSDLPPRVKGRKTETPEEDGQNWREGVTICAISVYERILIVVAFLTIHAIDTLVRPRLVELIYRFARERAKR